MSIIFSEALLYFIFCIFLNITLCFLAYDIHGVSYQVSITITVDFNWFHFCHSYRELPVHYSALRCFGICECISFSIDSNMQSLAFQYSNNLPKFCTATSHKHFMICFYYTVTYETIFKFWNKGIAIRDHVATCMKYYMMYVFLYLYPFSLFQHVILTILIIIKLLARLMFCCQLIEQSN